VVDVVGRPPAALDGGVGEAVHVVEEDLGEGEFAGGRDHVTYRRRMLVHGGGEPGIAAHARDARVADLGDELVDDLR
jgi:hypothetical protein